ncbi:uncharacterized protein LOC111717014 [Eurytemora carolleeae]|uniref:uncharacterized protein LOC111717014 n=1 Tax=Eurytemora carolleeae TaxID=1294199 RepID=UPI000C7940DE|nr:uncharacterized protein LOC111717014 [Eurytemora carolleeae]|eukprot:XP_023348298.1 uncharacterized protein LOC111717014 [Eurytemora affinis]
MSETLNVFSRRALVAPTHFLILFPFPGADKCFPTRLPGTFVSSSFPVTSKFFYFLPLFSAMIIGVHPVGGFSTSTENVMNVVPVVDPENTGYGDWLEGPVAHGKQSLGVKLFGLVLEKLGVATDVLDEEDQEILMYNLMLSAAVIGVLGVILCLFLALYGWLRV